MVASCLKYYHHLMLQIVGDSSLAQAIDSLDEDENREVRKEVYAYSGLSLNFRNIFSDKKAINFINLPRNCNKNIVLWHDLINNSITDHKNNDGEPLSPAELCNSRLLRSHMRLNKNRPYNHWLKSQGHSLVFFYLKNGRSQFGSLAT